MHPLGLKIPDAQQWPSWFRQRGCLKAALLSFWAGHRGSPKGSPRGGFRPLLPPRSLPPDPSGPWNRRPELQGSRNRKPSMAAVGQPRPEAQTGMARSPAFGHGSRTSTSSLQVSMTRWTPPSRGSHVPLEPGWENHRELPPTAPSPTLDALMSVAAPAETRFPGKRWAGRRAFSDLTAKHPDGFGPQVS